MALSMATYTTLHGGDELTRAYTDTPDGQIHYMSDGSGEPIVLVHQAACSSIEYLRVLPILGKECRAMALDLPGHGQSDELPKEYTFDDFAESVVSFMDSLGIQKASLVGHHGSCYIVNQIAIKHPERVEKVVLQDCPFYKRPKGGSVMLNMYQCQYLELKRDGSHLVQEWEYLKQYSPDAPLDVLQLFTIAKLLCGPSGVRYYRAVASYDNTDKVGLIAQPTLLLSGKNEYYVRNIYEVQKRIPRSRIVLIEGGELYVSHTHAQQYADAVLDFLRNPGV